MGVGCSVNLVPASRLNALRRARRRSYWIGACTTSVLLVFAGWLTHQGAVTSLNHISARVYGLEVQRSDSQRRLVAASARRDELLQQLRIVAAARRPQPWAHRLVALTRAAPEGLFLTELRVATVSNQRTATTPGEVSPTVVTLLGYAVDHAALIQFIAALQELPEWSQVDLVRANQEPLGAGYAVAFEVSCKTEASAP